MKDNQAKYPQLRFKGFTDPWEERKLGEEAQLTMGQSPNSENYTENPDDYILVQGNADMKNGRVVPRVWTTQVTKKAEKSDLILSVRAPVGDIGKTDYDVVLGRGVAAIKGNEFIFQQLGKMKLTGYWTRYSTGSTFESINSNDIKDAKIMVPVEEEQQKIGSFFKQLDHLITLHQRKLDLLKEQKKGYLQKMFPKNGAKVPELRFAGFADDWEERKLGDIFSERNERANSGQYKMLSITVDSGIVPADSLDRKDNSSSDKSHYKRVFEGDIAYNSMRMWQGASGVSEMNGIVSPAYTVLKPSKQTDTKFISYLFKLTPMLQSFQKNSQGLTSDTWNLKYKQFSPIKVKIPILNEQMKIGKVLEMLDDSIAANQRKLEKLQELKKVYLQKMFV
ncbi:restriction endonuclease subunit S (plasmid) [Secundilactobacillus paracollinoides]|uniref:restriction endonuclease subunit S n=1 Tax=Secundilactobacillus paracollinoides TaxID=240427 RepID=UPI00081A93D1|nr:restriction endonuclease subunit S [Secundilactobacillus paracollinoides]ANZ65529.1 restriction endonuclease subunit S [Secundilactobacillus paracollinoides]ANZ65670.1 restriction endonuclease subunit S [Secundilactobacillus paracollinoides]